jgi:hypothetical protein
VRNFPAKDVISVKISEKLPLAHFLLVQRVLFPSKINFITRAAREEVVEARKKQKRRQ